MRQLPSADHRGALPSSLRRASSLSPRAFEQWPRCHVLRSTRRSSGRRARAGRRTSVIASDASVVIEANRDPLGTVHAPALAHKRLGPVRRSERFREPRKPSDPLVDLSEELLVPRLLRVASHELFPLPRRSPTRQLGLGMLTGWPYPPQGDGATCSARGGHHRSCGSSWSRERMRSPSPVISSYAPSKAATRRVQP